MKRKTITVSTAGRDSMRDITAEIAREVKTAGWDSGILTVFTPHTTAAVTINENADPDVVTDMLSWLRRNVPQSDGYRHAEGNADSHVKSSMFGCSEQVIVDGGRLQLGTWQGIYFCEFDGPRTREVWLAFAGQ